MTSPPPRRRRTFWAGLAAVFALALLLRAPVAGLPLERDEGGYAYMGRQWLGGGLPYRDSFDLKPPGVFAVYAVLLRFLPPTPAALHWSAQVYTLGTLGLVALLGRRLFSPGAGLAAASFCAFLTVDRSVLGNAANTELFMLLPLTAGLLCTLAAAARTSLGLALAAGALAGAAVLFKQVAGANLAYFLLLLLLLAPRRRVLLGIVLLAGFALALAAAGGYFAAAGAWAEFYDCTLGYGFAYAAQTPLAEYPVNFWATFRPVFLSG